MSGPREDPRYAPPGAEVADLAPPSTRGEPPLQVRWAIRLLWAGLALSVVSGAVGFFGLLNADPAEFSLTVLATFTVLMALGLALTAWLILKMREGRGWARIAYLVLWLLSVALMLLPGDDTAVTFFEEAASVVTALVELAALVMLFMPPAARWFQRR